MSVIVAGRMLFVGLSSFFCKHAPLDESLSMVAALCPEINADRAALRTNDLSSLAEAQWPCLISCSAASINGCIPFFMSLLFLLSFFYFFLSLVTHSMFPLVLRTEFLVEYGRRLLFNLIWLFSLICLDFFGITFHLKRTQVHF